MQVICPKCGKVLGGVEAVARLILTVHCPFDGHDFGVAVDAPAQTELPADAPVKETLADA